MRCMLLFIALFAAAVCEAIERPNIIFVLSDDLAQGDIGCYGKSIIQTPNLDRMAVEGTRLPKRTAVHRLCSFTHFFDDRLHTGHSPVRANWEIAKGEVNYLYPKAR